MKKWYIVFKYDEKGYGNLSLHEDSLIAIIIPSRTGSLRATKDPITGAVTGTELVNGLRPGLWWIMDRPVDTTEAAMDSPLVVDKKVRLYEDPGKFTHYLIHFDAGKPGTKGCIGTQDAEKTLVLMDRITNILKLQKRIAVYANIPPVIDNEEEKPEEVPVAACNYGTVASKAGVEAVKVSALVLAILKVLDIETSPEQTTIITALPGILAGAIRGLRNWFKHRK